LDGIPVATGEKKINVLGFCIGGTLVTATLAYFVAKDQQRAAFRIQVQTRFFA
jgi:polyhydroxyalkanoate synthase